MTQRSRIQRSRQSITSTSQRQAANQQSKIIMTLKNTSYPMMTLVITIIIIMRIMQANWMTRMMGCMRKWKRQRSDRIIRIDQKKTQAKSWMPEIWKNWKITYCLTMSEIRQWRHWVVLGWLYFIFQCFCFIFVDVQKSWYACFFFVVIRYIFNSVFFK